MILLREQCVRKYRPKFIWQEIEALAVQQVRVVFSVLAVRLN